MGRPSRRAVRPRLHRHPDLRDLRHLGRLGRRGRLRPGERAVDPRVHRRRRHLGARVPPDPQARGVSCDVRHHTNHRRLRRPPRRGARTDRTAARRKRWLLDVGWKYLLAVVIVFYAVFPLVYVLSASLNPQGTLSASNALFSMVDFANYAALSGTSYWTWACELAADRGHRRGGRRADGRGGGVRLLAIPLLGAPCQPHRPAHHPDVPAGAGVRRHLPHAARARRGGARARHQLEARADLRLPRRCARGEHLPDVRVLQHDARSRSTSRRRSTAPPTRRSSGSSSSRS